MQLRMLSCTACALLVMSCGGGDKKQGGESVAKRAGSKVGETLTDFASGVGKGVDTTLVIPVDLSDDLKSSGVSKTVAKSLGIEGHGKGFTVYLVTTKPLVGDLIAKAYDQQGQEIGRAKSSVKMTADEAKYVTFTFESEMDSNLVVRYAISMARR